MIQKIILTSFVLLMFGCEYGINKRTHNLGRINTDKLCKKTRENQIKIFSSLENIPPLFAKKIKNFRSKPHDCDIVYFSSFPKELVGISKDRYVVRYVYNPLISEKVLDGFSEELTDEKREKVIKRVENLYCGNERISKDTLDNGSLSD